MSQDSSTYYLSGTLKYFFLKFCFFRYFFYFLALFLGKRGLPCENLGQDLHVAPVNGPCWPLQKIIKKRDLEISKILNIDKVDGTYLASPRGLRWGKTEPPDYILMFCSANVPGITYKISCFGIFVLHFWKTYLRVPPSKIDHTLPREIQRVSKPGK